MGSSSVRTSSAQKLRLRPASSATSWVSVWWQNQRSFPARLRLARTSKEWLKSSRVSVKAATTSALSDVTRILTAIEQGDPHAADKLLPLVYEELRKLAAHRMA